MLNYTNDMKKLDEELRHFHYNENGKFKGAQEIESIMLKIWNELVVADRIHSDLTVEIERDKMDNRAWVVVYKRNKYMNGFGADDLDNPKRIQKYEIDRYCYIKDFINALEVRYVDEIFEIGNGITVKEMIEWLEKIDNKEKEVAVFDYDRGIEISIDSKVELSKKVVFNSFDF